MISKVIKLIKIVKSTNDKKKYEAHFLLDNDKIKIVRFGQAKARDFSLINDKSSPFYLPKVLDRNVVKASYLRRHEKREDWTNPLTAGALSRWILWDRPTLAASIKSFKKIFKL